ncbi:MAG: NAD(P)H-dependent amine dehydrogenase family protein [Candidatus Odinarchaeia archaeon]
MKKIKVVQYGLGPIGREIAKLVLNKKDLELVGGVDIDPEIYGKDLGEILGVGALGVNVLKDAKQVFSQEQVDLAYISTVSHLKEIYPQLMECINAGVNVISTCEGLFYPYPHNAEIAEKIDKAAKEHQVTVLGTGVNPGFVFDTLIGAITSVCRRVDRIYALRIQDAGKRRLSFQKKIGAGLTVDQFNKEILGKKGHVGFKESISMISDILGWEISEINESMEPVIAEEDVSSRYIKVKKGKVCGLKQIAEGKTGNDIKIHLEIQFYIGAKETYDLIEIEGDPPMRVKIDPGIQGDTATAAICVNMAKHVVESDPGLKTMLDLPIPRFLI